MRILNICFKNINSLEGEGRVDFDQGPIADSGVFAITGPNGSGKTSILDVITLALYGETFRFDKPAAHVITQRAEESLAQVEFTLGQDKYRSSWWVRNTAHPIPDMNLVRVDHPHEILAQTPNQVRSRIAELTGMDFHRFSKSIVLPQGDFAAFLHALDSERMDILEKISGNDLYDAYRRQAENDYDQARTRLEQLQQDISSIPLLNQESLEAAELDLHDFRDQLAELLHLQQQLQSDLGDIQALRHLSSQRQTLEDKRQKLLTELQEYQQLLQQIAAGQAAKQHAQHLLLLDEKQASIEQQRTELQALRADAEALRQQLGNAFNADTPPNDTSLAEQKQAIDALKLSISDIKLELPRQTELAQTIQQQLDNTHASLSDVEAWLTSHASDASLIDDFPDVARLRNLRGELAELGGRHKAQVNWSKSTSAALKKNKTALEDVRKELLDLQEQIENDQKTLEELAQGRSLEELQALIQDQQTRVNDFRELCTLAEVTIRLTKKGWFSWLSNKKQPEQMDEGELKEQLAVMQDEVTREENIIKVLEQAIRNEAMIKKMSADRARLIEGQPCYLCGSIDHPYVRKAPAATDAKKALIDQRGKIQDLKSRIQRTTALLKTTEKSNSKLTAKQTRLLQIRSQWTVLANRLAIMRDGMRIENLALQRRLFNEENEELNRILQLAKECARLHRSTVKAQASIETKQALLEKLTESLAELEATWNDRPTDFDATEQRHAQCQAEEKALTAKLEAQLNALGEKLPGKGKENALFDRLNGRRQDYQVYQLRQKGLSDEAKALGEKLSSCQNGIIAYQQRLTSSLEALNDLERIGLHVALLDKQKLIADQEHVLRNAEIDYDALQRVLGEKLIADGIANIAALRTLWQLLQREEHIQQQYHRAESQLKEFEQQIEHLNKQFDELSAVQKSDLMEADVERSLRNLAERAEISEQEIQTLQNKLDKQQSYRDRYFALKQQLDEQERVFEQTAQELALVRGEQGEFRRRIQQMMIDKLLAHSNRILEKLSGRYYVRAAASDMGLALEIEDTKQHNLRRLPRSLSGGESFVVSLALALALAEMASNGHAIDSLFLDEGFGNLDAESLYLAMSALEELKTQGKTVGVISHVDAVKKRIKTQIELVKKANGLSELKLVA